MSHAYTIFGLAALLLLPAFTAHRIANHLLNRFSPIARLVVAMSLWVLLIWTVLFVLAPFAMIRTIPVLFLMTLLAVAACRLEDKVEAPFRFPQLPFLTKAGLALFVGALLAHAARMYTTGAIFFSDDYAYHGPVVTEWLRSGTLTHPMINFASYYPLNSHLTTLYLSLPAGNFRWSWLVNLYWIALGGAALVALVSQRGPAAIACAGLAGAMFLLTREVDWYGAALTSTDIAGSVALLAAFAILVHTPPSPTGRELVVVSLLAGLMIGFSIGTKVNNVIPGVFALGYGLFFLRRMNDGWKSSLPYVGWAALGVFLTGSYWYFRNLITTNNPVFPVRVWFFTGPGTPHVFEQSKMTWFFRNTEDVWELGKEVLRLALDWPTFFGILAAVGLLFGCIIVAVWAFRLIRYRDTQLLTQPLPWLVLGALALLVVYPSMPYSGAYIGSSELLVARRYFLYSFMVGLLVCSWLAGSAGGRKFATIFALVALVVLVHWPRTGAGFVGIVAAVAFMAYPIMERAGWRVLSLLGVAVVLLVVTVRELTHDRPWMTFQVHRERIGFQQVMDALGTLESGARIAQYDHNSWETWHLYGPHLTLQPVLLDARGDEMRPLRLAYSQRRERPYDALGVPGMRMTIPPEEFLANLSAVQLDYLLIGRWDFHPEWPPQRAILLSSSALELVVANEYSELYRVVGHFTDTTEKDLN
ncbi:MAG: hypothetical protein JJU11_09230 [Candidatus Sumerlaeia bacterium]|nr:hypothetical protein [Candidatus Sumerlaeia bacterium]